MRSRSLAFHLSSKTLNPLCIDLGRDRRGMQPLTNSLVHVRRTLAGVDDGSNLAFRDAVLVAEEVVGQQRVFSGEEAVTLSPGDLPNVVARVCPGRGHGNDTRIPHRLEESVSRNCRV